MRVVEAEEKEVEHGLTTRSSTTGFSQRNHDERRTEEAGSSGSGKKHSGTGRQVGLYRVSEFDERLDFLNWTLPRSQHAEHDHDHDHDSDEEMPAAPPPKPSFSGTGELVAPR